MRIFVFFFCALISFSSGAQEFIGESTLPEIHTDGFYRVELRPQLTQWLAPDFHTVRVVDEAGKEIPYIVEETAVVHETKFVEYPVVEKTNKKNCCTTLIFENNTRSQLSNLMLRIRNAEVRKSASLSGSDDREQWYALKENFSLDYIEGATGTSEIRIVNFPLSEYAYYRLEIDDSASLPLNILQVGFNENYTATPSYHSITDVTITVADSVQLKRTYCTIKFDSTQWVDQLYLAASGMPFFKRRASLYEVNHFKSKKGVEQTSTQYLSAFEIVSSGPTLLNLKGSLAKEWLIIIENDDNPSLTIDSLSVSQLKRYLVTYLKQNGDYKIKVGNGLSKPVYDLEYFKSSIPGQAAIITPAVFTPYKTPQKSVQSSSFFNSTLWIWVAIAGVVVVLGIMSMRMIKETKARNDIQS